MSIKAISFHVVLFVGVSVPIALAQHDHGHAGGTDEHGKQIEFRMPTTYKTAVEEIQHRLHEIDVLIESKQLDKVHSQAEVIQKVGNVVGQLALKPDSGVPKTAVKEVNKAGRELAAKFDAIDKAGDSGDAAGTRKVYEEMVKLAATLGKYVPKTYACPMKCEGDKTYPRPGICPKCGMALTDVKPHTDHSPKHSGIFFMAPDQRHHLEGTMPSLREFRVYFYDEYTQAIAAKPFTAKGSVRRKNSNTELPLVMAAGPMAEFLSGTVDQSIEFPLSIKLFVDFKDGREPQVFDFDFDRPTDSATEADAGHDDDSKGG